MATSEGIPSSIDIEFLELNDNPYIKSIFDLDIFRNVRTTEIQVLEITE